MQSSTSTKIGAIILAAGGSTRMGTSKQMLTINGEHLLIRTIKAITEAGIGHIVVVLGAQEAVHRKILNNHPVDVVVNERWQTGMGSSIRAGLQQLVSANAGLDAVMIFVCDQPMLSSKLISQIVSVFKSTNKSIVASGYSDSSGVPALFARTRFAELKSLPDDQGAKKMIMLHPDDVVVVPFPGGEIDLDTMEEYERFVRSIESGGQSGTQHPEFKQREA